MKRILNVVILFFLVIPCNAQQAGERITSTLVIIYNNSNSKISILLGPPAGKMDTFNLKGNEVWYSPSYTKDPVIKIKTQSHVVNYQLRIGNSYMIFWNKKKKYWDITKTKNRK